MLLVSRNKYSTNCKQNMKLQIPSERSRRPCKGLRQRSSSSVHASAQCHADPRGGLTRVRQDESDRAGHGRLSEKPEPLQGFFPQRSAAAKPTQTHVIPCDPTSCAITRHSARRPVDVQRTIVAGPPVASLSFQGNGWHQVEWRSWAYSHVAHLAASSRPQHLRQKQASQVFCTNQTDFQVTRVTCLSLPPKDSTGLAGLEM